MRGVMYKNKKVTEGMMEQWLEWPMLFLTLLLVPIIAVPALYQLPAEWRNALEMANGFIWVAFYLEMFLKLVVSDNYIKTLLRNWFLVIILISPFLLVLRLVRFARFVSLFRLLRVQSFLRHLKTGTETLIHNLEYIFLAMLLFIGASALVMWQIESQLGGAIETFGDALWWSVITITTIGYGDIVPQTDEGRLFGSIISLIGILLFMVLVARTTSFFVSGKK